MSSPALGVARDTNAMESLEEESDLGKKRKSDEERN
jgi:hypothetical protein